MPYSTDGSTKRYKKVARRFTLVTSLPERQLSQEPHPSYPLIKIPTLDLQKLNEIIFRISNHEAVQQAWTEEKAANLFDNWCFLALHVQLISGSIECCILGNG